MKEIINSMTSIYQLLPIYPVLQVGDKSKRIAEAGNLPNIDPERAVSALEFHREIEAAVKANGHNAYATVPFVGVQQPTLQSAKLEDGKIFVSPPTAVNYAKS